MNVSHIANYYSKPVAPQMLSFKEVDEPYSFKPQKVNLSKRLIN